VDIKTTEYVIFGLLMMIVLVIYAKHKPVPIFIDQEKQKCESPIEHRLYNALADNGYYPVTQVKAGLFRIDIALMTHKIAIECDGKDFHSSAIDKARDNRKDAYLRSKGWIVLRFTGSRIHRDMNGILKNIDEMILNKISAK